MTNPTDPGQQQPQGQPYAAQSPQPYPQGQQTAPGGPQGPAGQYPPPGANGMPPGQKPKKPLVKRFWFWALIVVGVIIVASIGGSMGDDTAPTSGEATTASTEGSDDRDEAATEEADETTADEDADDAPDTETAGLGEEISIDDWTITVVSVGEPQDSVGSEFLSTDAQGVFVPVELTVTNAGNSAQFFFADNFTLTDEQGRDFSYPTDATIYGAADGAVSLLDEINPGNTIEGALYYDVPADAEPVSMVVAGGFLTNPVTISLN